MTLEPRSTTARLVVDFGICTFFPGQGKQTIAASQGHGLQIGHAKDVTYRFDGLDPAVVSRMGLTSRNVTKKTMWCQLYHSLYGAVEVEFTFGILPSLLPLNAKRSVSENQTFISLIKTMLTTPRLSRLLTSHLRN